MILIISIISIILILLYRIGNFHIIVVFIILVVTCASFQLREKFINYKLEHFAPDDTSLGAKIEHLQLAYNLCSNNKDSSLCNKYISHYDNLKKSFNQLKTGYCQNNRDKCKKIGL